MKQNGPGEELDHGSRVYPGAVVVSAPIGWMGCASRHTIAPHPGRWVRREASGLLRRSPVGVDGKPKAWRTLRSGEVALFRGALYASRGKAANEVSAAFHRTCEARPATTSNCVVFPFKYKKRKDLTKKYPIICVNLHFS